MINAQIPRIMIVGTNSGSGKTTVTCAILKAIKNRAYNISSFKCGPDYIDPMFHTRVLGIRASNLDLHMCDENTVRYLFAQNSAGMDISVVEGVMGMYDGVGNGDTASSNHLAMVLDIPQILVVSPKGISTSLAAIIHGFMNFRENNIKGIILNKVSGMMYTFYKTIIEKEVRIRVYGYLEDNADISFSSRHLGLIAADEIHDIEDRVEKLGDCASKTLDIDGIINIAEGSSALSYNDIEIPKLSSGSNVRIAVARDAAFCFYYSDNMRLLEKMGAEICYFSPLSDGCLPHDVSGIILGGGYPELYARQLEGNEAMRLDVLGHIRRGVPTIAECGGFMYLTKSISTIDGNRFSMVGAIDTNSFMGESLKNFGYIWMQANGDNLLCKKGDIINAHEFHYSYMDNAGDSFTVKKWNNRGWDCGHTSENLYAGYPHIHFWHKISIAESFLRRCIGGV